MPYHRTSSFGNRIAMVISFCLNFQDGIDNRLRHPHRITDLSGRICNAFRLCQQIISSAELTISNYLMSWLFRSYSEADKSSYYF